MLNRLKEKSEFSPILTKNSIVEYFGILGIALKNIRFLKIKSLLDRECRIVAHNRGHKKFKNLMGSVTFKIGSGFSLEERKNPPAIGTVVTFKYKEMTKYGKPRFPVFLRERKIK